MTDAATLTDGLGCLECSGCGLAFASTAAYAQHRPDGQCLSPPECGLTVAPLRRLTWTLPWLREVTDPRQAEDDY